MILRKHHRILVQGITGRQGSFWTQAMLDYGARVVGGVNPAKAGSQHLGLPVYAKASEADGFEVALLFVPPMAAKTAAIDAAEAGAQVIVCLSEHVPLHDTLEMLAAADANGARVFGPNTAGIATPGESFAGILPVFNKKLFRPGRIGLVSRSGSLGTLMAKTLSAAGEGISTFLGVGGDPLAGTSLAEAVSLLAADERTEKILLCGEIGGAGEEEAAERAKGLAKPLVAFVAGRAAPEGRKMGHAGAIVAEGKGGYADKRRALEAAGVAVCDLPSEAPALLAAA
ncbi:MAG: CoA-binding protein [Kiloniellales bacterium]